MQLTERCRRLPHPHRQKRRLHLVAISTQKDDKATTSRGMRVPASQSSPSIDTGLNSKHPPRVSRDTRCPASTKSRIQGRWGGRATLESRKGGHRQLRVATCSRLQPMATAKKAKPKAVVLRFRELAGAGQPIGRNRMGDGTRPANRELEVGARPWARRRRLRGAARGRAPSAERRLGRRGGHVDYCADMPGSR